MCNVLCSGVNFVQGSMFKVQDSRKGDSMKKGIDRFEDLECWQAARGLVKMIYSLINKGTFKQNFGLRDQIQKASLSVMANIAEGFGAFSNPEFVRFLRMAHRSCIEVQSHLYASLDGDYIGQEIFNSIFEETRKCLNLTRGLICYLRENKRRSPER